MHTIEPPLSSGRAASTPTPREKVRVARALTELPLLSEAMARGKLGYFKVRALTRIATPGNEPDLLEIGLHAVAQHVEKFVRCIARPGGPKRPSAPTPGTASARSHSGTRMTAP